MRATIAMPGKILGRTTQIVGLTLILSTALSHVHPWGNVRDQVQAGKQNLAGAAVPIEVERVLATKCGDCHSESTHWPVYSQFAPASWLMEHDVFEAREHLNLSRWREYSHESQIDLLTRIGAETRSGQMPPRQYLLLHPGAKLSSGEQQMIYEWARTERKRVKNATTEQK
jgi:cytochrome c